MWCGCWRRRLLMCEHDRLRLGPHPEEHRVAMRLEGWRHAPGHGSRRRAFARLLTMRAALLRRSRGFREVIERRDDMLGQRIGERVAFVWVAHQPDAA